MSKDDIRVMIDKLRSKLKKGTLSNREQGYNDGILVAMSMLSKQIDVQEE